jgi:hypothetical protein
MANKEFLSWLLVATCLFLAAAIGLVGLEMWSYLQLSDVGGPAVTTETETAGPDTTGAEEPAEAETSSEESPATEEP